MGDSLRTPLSRVTGLGSAKDGTHHWWMQRLTAIALVPLTFWFVASLASLVGADRDQVADWMAGPLPALLMILFLGTAFYHFKLGLQVVIEDYVHAEWVKITLLVLNNFFCIALGGACVLSVLLLLFGG